MTLAARIALASATLATLVSFGRPADACWDGFAAQTDKVSVLQAGDSEWRPETARSLAQWLPRIGALLPDGTELESEHGFVTISSSAAGASPIEARWDGASLPQLFQLVVRTVPGARARQALGHGRTPFTVQVLAVSDEKRAQTFAAALDARNTSESLVPSSSFYVAGGFPAFHPEVHVLTPSAGDKASGLALTRVVVGAYLDVESAQATASSLRAHGVQAFVRPL